MKLDSMELEEKSMLDLPSHWMGLGLLRRSYSATKTILPDIRIILVMNFRWEARL